MKKILLSIALFLSIGITAWAQTPQQFNYQGIARSAEGIPLASTLIGLRLTVHEGSATGSIDYQETQSTTTNQFGIFTVFIGGGTSSGTGAATLGGVVWATGTKFLQVEIDPAGATNYSAAGTTQLLSVPYALYAGSAPATGVTSVTAGAGLNGGTITTTGTVSMPTEGTPGTYGSGTTVPVITTDAYGRITGVTNTPIVSGAGTVTSVSAGAGLAGGPITTSGSLSLGAAGTPGTYGSGTTVPVFTTDIYGRVIAVANTPITVAGTGTVTSVTAGAGLAGGTITSTGTLSLGTTGTPGTYGSATAIPVITTDIYGRVTGVTTAAISAGGVAGTPNYIAMFNTATSVANSTMYNTPSGDVGLGTITPVATFDVENSTDAMVGNFTSSNITGPPNGVLSASYTGSDITDPTAAIVGTSTPDPTLATSVGVGTVGVGGSLGLSGVAESTDPGGAPTAVQGQSFSDGFIGSAVAGFASAALVGAFENYGVYGQTDGSGLFADFAGEFEGNLDCSGNFTCGGTKAFRMDDPIDPANKFLYHSCVESNEMMDMYTGNITTDASGSATVVLPAYFEALNKDFRYQLTVIGTFAQAIIGEKVSGNKFVIKTNQPNVEVSWQVTGVRHDAYASAHPIIAEVEKPSIYKGKYIHPELFGQTMDQQIGRMTAKNLKLKGVKTFSSVTKNPNSKANSTTNPDKK